MLADGTPPKALWTPPYLRRRCRQADDCDVNMAYSSTKRSSTPVPQQYRSKATCMPVKKVRQQGQHCCRPLLQCSKARDASTQQPIAIQKHRATLVIYPSASVAGVLRVDRQSHSRGGRLGALALPVRHPRRVHVQQRRLALSGQLRQRSPISVGWQGRWSTRCLRVRRASEGLQPRLAPASGGAAAATRWPCKG